MNAGTAELEQFLEANPDVTHIDALVIDLCGNAIGKRLPVAQAQSLFITGTPICAAMQLVDVLGNTADPMGHGFSDGDPDAFARPLSGTLAPVPWNGQGHAQVLCELQRASDGEPLWYDPRHVLEGVVKRFEELEARPVVAAELEFYLIDAARAGSGAPRPASSPRSGAAETQGKVLSLDKLDEFAQVLSGIESACAAQAIPTTTMISEYGAGQFEINLAHQDDPVRAADHAALLRRAVQGVARAGGLDASFMSKPFADQSGSGLHIHLSLANARGENLFDPARDGGDKRLGHAVAGLQATLAESMGLFAPNINVYRRFKPDQFVPVTRDWGENNRSVAFRLPIGDGQNRRLEHRVAGAEANPYLVMAAVLAGVHYGLVHALDPGDKHAGNAGAEVDANLPLTPWDAFRRTAQAEILPGYLGAEYPRIYAEVKQAEFDAFMEEAFSREYDWYL
ncbi:MAG: glutamine synthetase [Gammaproteobacteria bacterium]|nr:glutamine synthetase [Gammaproteobacteria bacterium]NIM72888.1 glutamine synthetase [Gammaproteobacteria bacterium]NIN38499.1 glutamine synthetase [Gammaproteobacteria bacterium]NIO24640.1 glutamine synthetase [Gammaproteobacteria bacterium]NIO65243.1 glutamine synthetase [Gammaproteobacteria bacterium]